MIEKLLDEAKQCELVAKQCSDKASGLKQLALQLANATMTEEAEDALDSAWSACFIDQKGWLACTLAIDADSVGQPMQKRKSRPGFVVKQEPEECPETEVEDADGVDAAKEIALPVHSLPPPEVARPLTPDSETESLERGIEEVWTEMEREMLVPIPSPAEESEEDDGRYPKVTVKCKDIVEMLSKDTRQRLRKHKYDHEEVWIEDFDACKRPSLKKLRALKARGWYVSA